MYSTSPVTRLGLGAATAATGLLVVIAAGLPAGATPHGGRASEEPSPLPRTCVTTADTAEHWATFAHRLPCLAQGTGHAGLGCSGPYEGTADAAEYWTRHAGHPAGCPG